MTDMKPKQDVTALKHHELKYLLNITI